jgi:hypothetical protein
MIGGPESSPMRLLEALTDRFGVFEALATATIQLARLDPEPDLPMEPHVAEAVLEFGDDLRGASAAVNHWARATGLTRAPPTARQPT